MHIATFLFVCIETVIFFYLLIYRLARPDDKTAYLNIILIFLLLIYNITGGLLPDKNLPGSFFIQMIIAYATGFITPCYFPYYVHKTFGLEKMKFHAYKGVYYFLITPYVIFVLIFAFTNNLNQAKELLALPVLYALWVIVSLIIAIRFKYQNNFNSKGSKVEITVLLLSLTPWVGLPVIDFFNLGQAIEASITNLGFLLLFALQMKRHIKEMRIEHQRLIESEKRLLNWNSTLQGEVNKRTKELEKINEQRLNTFINLAHETKTPLTLISNYLDEYIIKNKYSEELSIVKRNLSKLSTDIVNLFDLEKFNKGFAVYNHTLVCNFSEIVKDSAILFKPYAANRNIELSSIIEEGIYVKADPLSINRIVNNLIENAVKYSNTKGAIEILLYSVDSKIRFVVKDDGIGIPLELHKKVFEPYYQIASQKKNIQGMGLGLPIVKKVVEDLTGKINILSNPKLQSGTEITVTLNRHIPANGESISRGLKLNTIAINTETAAIREFECDPNKQNILILEDNIAMLNYLSKKLQQTYNVQVAIDGNDALKKLKDSAVIPDLIISDVMMDKLDGISFANIISENLLYNFIPIIFLSAKNAYSDKLKGLKSGAVDYISKPFSISELLQKMESILTTASNQKSAILNTALKSLSNADSSPVSSSLAAFEKNCKFYQLTNREKEIAKLICRGYKYKDIGEKLYIAERTVTKHAQNIFEKVGISNKIELMNKLEFL